jgi:hypothetical protein
MTSNATRTTSNSSEDAMSNIQLANPAGRNDANLIGWRVMVSVDNAPILLGFIGLLFGVDNGRGTDLWRSLWRVVVFAHAFFEAFNALGNVAHHVGKTALAEQEQNQNADNQPMPDTKTAHFKLLPGFAPKIATVVAQLSYPI